MKVFVFLVSLSYILETTKAIRCLTCQKARSNRECLRIGKAVECESNTEDACQNEFRRNGRPLLITKRCKQALACNFVQNNKDSWSPVLCNMERAHTVCRCCCYDNSCNVDTHLCPNDCNPLKVPSNGGKQCQYVGRQTELGSQCIFTCDEGYTLVGSPSSTCVRANYRSDFTHSTPECVPITGGECTRQIIIQHGHVTCRDGSQHGSRCQFKCDHGFVLFGSQTTTCGTDDEWSHKRPYCVAIHCYPEAEDIERGSVECTNDNLVASVCTFTCESGFRSEGKTSMTCNEDGEGNTTVGVWSNEPHPCNRDARFRYSCKPDHVDPTNGRVSCTDSNYYDSVCSFVCDEGSVRVGEPQSICLGDEQDPIWTTKAPTCEQKTCHYQRLIENGRYGCSKKNTVGSTCVFTCDEGYFLHPNITTNTCEQTSSGTDWNRPMSCCSPRSPLPVCPPYAVLDTVFSLDNPASIGHRAWLNQDRFRKLLQNQFVTSPILAKFWNLLVTTEVVKGVEIPTEGVDPWEIIDQPFYHIGIALRKILTDTFKVGNGERPDAPNVAIFVTEGNVPDELEVDWIRKNAQALRDSGVTIYAIGVGDKEPLEQTLNDLTEQGNIYRVNTYTDLLDSVDVIAQMLCPNLCPANN